jgi:hypothetical protein
MTRFHGAHHDRHDIVGARQPGFITLGNFTGPAPSLSADTLGKET